MTIQNVLKYVDELYENVFSDGVKLRWLNQLEAELQTEVLLLAADGITQYTGEDEEAELIAPAPFDKIYEDYLIWRIAIAQGEAERANNLQQIYEQSYLAYVRFVCETVNPGDGQAEATRYYLSAYQIAVKHGYAGTETEWLDSLKGTTGEPGTGLNIKGQVQMEAELPESGLSEGDGYLVGSGTDALLYIWDGANWFYKARLSVKGDKGEKGDPGEKGEKGDTGATGATGAAFTYDMFTPDQLAALTGPQGEKGDPGEKGERGDTGATGAPGEKGEKGDKGDAGATGAVGAKGDKGEKGEKGEKGDTGAGFRVLGYYASVEALGAAVTSPAIGDAYGVGSAAPYDIYIYSPTGWVNNGQLQGAKGDPGPKGEKGDPGEPGAKGEKGDKGDPGEDGGDGLTPTIGANGNWYLGDTDTGKPSRGEKGDTGVDGAPGAKGEKGEKGDAGATGARGADGAPGAKGEKGDSGEDGLTPTIGANGNWYLGDTDTGKPSRGEKGDTGADGAPGAKGEKGDKGDTGAAGAPGAKGDKGDTGATGATGAKGEKGDKGDAGAGVQSMTYNSSTNKWTVTLTNGSTLTVDGPAIPDVSAYMPKSGGTFSGAVKAATAETGSYYVRNIKFSTSEETPTAEGDICFKLA